MSPAASRVRGGKVKRDSSSTIGLRSPETIWAEDRQPSGRQVWRATFTPRDGVRLHSLDVEETADVERDEKDMPRIGSPPRQQRMRPPDCSVYVLNKETVIFCCNVSELPGNVIQGFE